MILAFQDLRFEALGSRLDGSESAFEVEGFLPRSIASDDSYTKCSSARWGDPSQRVLSTDIVVGRGSILGSTVIVWVSISIYIYTYIHTHTYRDIHSYIQKCMHPCIHTNIH